MADYLDFEDIYQAVCRAIGDLQYGRLEEVKAIVNMVYLNEILQCDDLYPLFWLLECDDSKKSKVRKAITDITVGGADNAITVTSAAHGFATGDLITIYDVLGMVELNYRTFRTHYVGADTFTLRDLTGTVVDGSAFTAYTSGGYAHHRGFVAGSGIRRILYANWHGYNKGLSFISPEELEAKATYWDKSTSRPTRIMTRKVWIAGVYFDYLLWFQAADAAYNLRLWYEREPARLSATTDIPYLPHQFHDAIVAGAITRLGENKVQVEAGIVWPMIYKAQIDAIKTYNRRWWEEHKPYERSGLFLA